MPRAADVGRHDGGDAGARAPFFFEGIESPNGTIFPDTLLDLVMPFLSPTEWKVCSYIVRRTFGWKKASDRISLEQICHGIMRRDGSRLDHGTQLDRKTAIKALRGLEAKGVIVAQRNYSDARGFEATTYGLRFRGQPPTRTLVEKLPKGDQGPGEILHQGPGEQSHEAPGEDLPQASGALPPALVATDHPQPTTGTTTPATRRNAKGRNASPFPSADSPDATTASSLPPSDEPTLAGATCPPGKASEQRLTGEAHPDASRTQAPGTGTDGTASESDAAIWSAVLARLEQQMTAANYQTWLADTWPLGRRGATLIVGAPSGFVRDWLQTRFRALVRRAVQEAAPAITDVSFAVVPGAES
jgi:hypothetical protein